MDKSSKTFNRSGGSASSTSGAGNFEIAGPTPQPKHSFNCFRGSIEQNRQRYTEFQKLSPRSRKNYFFKTEIKQYGRRTVTRSFVDFIEDLDFFAKPVINFNMRGKEKVSSRIGLFASFIIVSIVLYLALGGLVVVAR